jgi:hypothetical protein
MSVIAGETGFVIEELAEPNVMDSGVEPVHMVRVRTDMKMEQFVDFTNPLRRISRLNLLEKVVCRSALTKCSDSYGNEWTIQTGWTDREIVVRADEVRPLLLVETDPKGGK